MDEQTNGQLMVAIPGFARHMHRAFITIQLKKNKKFELMLTRRAKAYSSSGSVV